MYRKFSTHTALNIQTDIRIANYKYITAVVVTLIAFTFMVAAQGVNKCPSNASRLSAEKIDEFSHVDDSELTSTLRSYSNGSKTHRPEHTPTSSLTKVPIPYPLTATTTTSPNGSSPQ